MKLIYRLVPATATLLLAACTNAVAAKPPNVNPPSTAMAAPTATSPLPSPTAARWPSGDMTRVDEQGNVVVEVTPLNLKEASEALEFEVVMNTHSVDLTMDLAALASLTTDTGSRALAVSWDGSPGGHHVAGKLIFFIVRDGKSLLEGATTLTLTIIDVYAPSRTFEWDLQ
ncbi:MAG: hypothetical protein V1755_13320 [Chloroflexota bacterium]